MCRPNNVQEKRLYSYIFLAILLNQLSVCRDTFDTTSVSRQEPDGFQISEFSFFKSFHRPGDGLKNRSTNRECLAGYLVLKKNNFTQHSQAEKVLIRFISRAGNEF